MTYYSTTSYERKPELDRLAEELREMHPENEVVLDSGIVAIITKDHPLFNILREMRQKK